MPVDKVDIWNRALGRIAAKPVASEDEISLSAQECRRFYPEVISNMLEGPEDWSFAKQRVTLALAASNDRPSEWLYAYSVPSDMASPVRVIPDLSAAGTLIPVPLPGQPYAETWAAYLDDIAAPYVLDKGIIYCNEVNAILEYIVNSIDALTVSAMVTRAIAAELAALVAMPLKKDRALAQSCSSEAGVMWERAIADDRNRQPEQWGTYESESILARHDDC